MFFNSANGILGGFCLSLGGENIFKKKKNFQPCLATILNLIYKIPLMGGTDSLSVYGYQHQYKEILFNTFLQFLAIFCHLFAFFGTFCDLEPLHFMKIDKKPDTQAVMENNFYDKQTDGHCNELVKIHLPKNIALAIIFYMPSWQHNWLYQFLCCHSYCGGIFLANFTYFCVLKKLHGKGTTHKQTHRLCDYQTNW